MVVAHKCAPVKWEYTTNHHQPEGVQLMTIEERIMEVWSVGLPGICHGMSNAHRVHYGLPVRDDMPYYPPRDKPAA